MSRVTSLFTVGHLLLAAALVAAPHTAVAAGGSWVEVTVTNITRGQIISPVVVATHTHRFEPLFELGSPASDELAAVAEDAILDPLVSTLSADPQVHDVQVLRTTEGPIPPGQSATARVRIRGWHRQITMVAMLVTTNDAFFALRGVSVPFGESSADLVAPAYDAGSEANTERCDHIPGPPCDNPGIRIPEGAEGYVHIHAGIHGIADLEPDRDDWRNPVARVTVRRLIGPDRP